MVYLISRVWIDPMENQTDAAVGYMSIGYVKTEQEAIDFCLEGRKFTNKDCWAIRGAKDEFTYKPLKELT